jgi:hypothetical protein
MYKYKFVHVVCKQGIFSNTHKEYRDIIHKCARKGYRFVGFIPVKVKDYGMLKEIDLVFEKSVFEKNEEKNTGGNEQ